MARRAFLSGALLMLAAPAVTPAQPRPKIYRIGWVGPTSPTPETARIHAVFRRGLQDLGYVEGRDYVIELRWAYGRMDQLPALTAELVADGVDLLVAVTGQTAHAAKHATTTIPIVLITPDPLSSGLVTNLARPGGNITGVTMFAGPDLVGKYLDLIREAVPAVSRIGLLWSESSPWQVLMVREAAEAARRLGLHFHAVRFQTAGDFETAYAELAASRSQAVVVMPDAITFVHRKTLAELALRHRLPQLSSHLEGATDGSLMAYAANIEDLFHRAASYVDRLIKGARPGDLPIEQPTRFALAINQRTAKTLGVTIPPALLLRADRVIE